MKLKRLLFFVPVVGFLVIPHLDAAGPLSRFFGDSKISTPVKDDRQSVQSKIHDRHTPLQRRGSYDAVQDKKLLDQSKEVVSPAMRGPAPLPPRSGVSPAAMRGPAPLPSRSGAAQAELSAKPASPSLRPTGDRSQGSLPREEKAASQSPRDRLIDIKQQRQAIKKETPTERQREALDAEAAEQILGREKGKKSAREKYKEEFEEIDKKRDAYKALKDEEKKLKADLRKEKISNIKGKVFGKKKEQGETPDTLNVSPKSSIKEEAVSHEFLTGKPSKRQEQGDFLSRKQDKKSLEELEKEKSNLVGKRKEQLDRESRLLNQQDQHVKRRLSRLDKDQKDQEEALRQKDQELSRVKQQRDALAGPEIAKMRKGVEQEEQKLRDLQEEAKQLEIDQKKEREAKERALAERQRKVDEAEKHLKDLQELEQQQKRLAEIDQRIRALEAKEAAAKAGN